MMPFITILLSSSVTWLAISRRSSSGQLIPRLFSVKREFFLQLLLIGQALGVCKTSKDDLDFHRSCINEVELNKVI